MFNNEIGSGWRKMVVLYSCVNKRLDRLVGALSSITWNLFVEPLVF